METVHRETPLRSLPALRAVLAFLARLVTALVLLVIAALIAFVTAVAGLALAAAALLVRFSVTSRHARRTPSGSRSSDITLEARPTPRGWTVET